MWCGVVWFGVVWRGVWLLSVVFVGVKYGVWLSLVCGCKVWFWSKL